MVREWFQHWKCVEKALDARWWACGQPTKDFQWFSSLAIAIEACRSAYWTMENSRHLIFLSCRFPPVLSGLLSFHQSFCDMSVFHDIPGTERTFFFTFSHPVGNVSWVLQGLSVWMKERTFLRVSKWATVTCTGIENQKKNCTLALKMSVHVCVCVTVVPAA